MFEDVFYRKRIVPEKLSEYGFQKVDSRMKYTTEIMDGEFILTVMFDENGTLDTNLVEKETGDEYVLYKTGAKGPFVEKVREGIENVLIDISKNCTEQSIFHFAQTLRIIEYVDNKHHDPLEFLWEKFPDNAVYRRNDNAKWYAAILTVEKKKLGLDGNEKVEILDLRIAKEEMEELLKKEHFYPGWHMNKKSWYTVILDGSVDDEQLKKLIEISYELAK